MVWYYGTGWGGIRPTVIFIYIIIYTPLRLTDGMVRDEAVLDLQLYLYILYSQVNGRDGAGWGGIRPTVIFIYIILYTPLRLTDGMVRDEAVLDLQLYLYILYYIPRLTDGMVRDEAVLDLQLYLYILYYVLFPG